MKHGLVAAFAALGGLLALPVPAQERASLTYADFEASVPHIDMADCPPALAEGDVFCRITMNNDALHVYVFAAGGDQHFVAVHSYHEDAFSLVLGTE